MGRTLHTSDEVVECLVGYERIPEDVRTLSPLSSPDYADMFSVAADVPEGTSPQGLIGSMLRGAPSWLQRGVPFVHEVVLGLQLHDPPNAPGYVMGWAVAEGGDDWIRLEADSHWWGKGNIIGKFDAGRVSFATFVQYKTPIARIVWGPISVLHRYVARTLMMNVARDLCHVPRPRLRA